MRTVYVMSFLLMAAAAPACAGTSGGFVKGTTTLAEVEQGLGAPMGTAVKPNGALILIYPAARLAERMPAALPATTASQTVALQFGRDFTYENAKITEAAETGIAAR